MSSTTPTTASRRRETGRRFRRARGVIRAAGVTVTGRASSGCASVPRFVSG
jgi:hypothetical protein